MRRAIKAFVAFTAVDGEKSIGEVLPLFDDLFHPDAQVTTGNGTVGLAEWRAFVEKFGGAGGKIDLDGFEVVSSNAIRYKLTMTMPSGVIQRTVTMGTFKEGRLYRVVPAVPDLYCTTPMRAV